MCAHNLTSTMTMTIIMKKKIKSKRTPNTRAAFYATLAALTKIYIYICYVRRKTRELRYRVKRFCPLAFRRRPARKVKVIFRIFPPHKRRVSAAVVVVDEIRRGQIKKLICARPKRNAVFGRKTCSVHFVVRVVIPYIVQRFSNCR